MARIDDLENMIRQVTKAAQKPIRPDAASMAIMQAETTIQANSARELARITQMNDERMQEIAEQNERRNAAIQRSAENSDKQVDLLEKQLQEVRAQNEILQTQNEMLKTEAAANRAEIEANKKANKNTRIFSIVTTVISIAIALAGLIIAIA